MTHLMCLRGQRVFLKGGFIGLKMKPGDKQISRLCKKLIGMGFEVLHATTSGKNDYYIVI